MVVAACFFVSHPTLGNLQTFILRGRTFYVEATSLKEREVHTAIHPLLYEMGMRLEGILLAVLQDEKSVFFQQAVGEDQIGESLQIGQFVGRVCKNEIELFMAILYVLEHVAPYGQTFVGLHLPHHLADESVVVAVLLDADDLPASARDQFDADASRTGKKIERTHMIFLEVEVVRR